MPIGPELGGVAPVVQTIRSARAEQGRPQGLHYLEARLTSQLSAAVRAGLCLAALLVGAACGPNVPESATGLPGTPRVSWVIMSGDRDNPDADFVCQSDPRNECVVPVSRPDAQVFSDVHMYYHRGTAETTYAGTIQIGHFQASRGMYQAEANIVVPANQAIVNQSIAGLVTSTPGTYEITIDVVASTGDAGAGQPIRERIVIVVK
jgi:hypothetical protein